ncbi:MAG: hypothetical protein IJT66_00785, partial [Clostridia bacterium]|nr:hypothetical protein [Clostridia bacterium]
NEPGEYQLDVVGAKNTAVTDYEIVSISPSSVKVSFDYVETKEFTLKAVAEGAAAEKGLIAEAAVVSGTESDTITIQGPRTIVNKIDSAVAYTEVNETLSESRTFNADIHLYDADGKELDMTNLTLSTTKVQVTVPIAKRATVPVVAEFTNLPSDFSKSSLSYQIDHSSVTVIGTPSTIDEIKQVTLSPIDITNVSTSSNRFDVSAKLPDGVRLLDSIETFTVTIDTSDYKVAVFNISDVHFTHLSSGLKASSDSVIKNVKICGPRRVIAKLKESTLYAEADLTDKVAGEHTVAVSVKSDNIHNIWQVGSYSTTVKIQ